MLEAIVTVVRVEGGTARVEAEPRSACGRCAAAQRCGTGALVRLGGGRRPRLAIANSLRASEGEEVVIGIADDALVRASATVYGIPLLAMAAPTLLASGLGLPAGVAAPAGLAGLLLALLLVGRSTRGSGPQLQPRMLRRRTASPPARERAAGSPAALPTGEVQE